LFYTKLTCLSESLINYFVVVNYTAI